MLSLTCIIYPFLEVEQILKEHRKETKGEGDGSRGKSGYKTNSCWAWHKTFNPSSPCGAEVAGSLGPSPSYPTELVPKHPELHKEIPSQKNKQTTTAKR